MKNKLPDIKELCQKLTNNILDCEELRNTPDYYKLTDYFADHKDIKVYLEDMPEYKDLNQYLNLFVYAGGRMNGIYGTIERWELDEDGFEWLFIHKHNSLLYHKYGINDLKLVHLYKRIL